MINGWEQDRRDFLKLLAALPVVYMIGCEAGETPPADMSQLPSAEDSLRKLIRLLGPWDDKASAEDFIRRFLGSEAAVAPYLPDKGLSIRTLARRFPDSAGPLDTVNLKEIPEPERELLLELTRQLYSFIEIRFLVSKEPPWGECQPQDRLRYTRAPG
jgi:hypothetical protein